LGGDIAFAGGLTNLAGGKVIVSTPLGEETLSVAPVAIGKEDLDLNEHAKGLLKGTISRRFEDGRVMYTDGYANVVAHPSGAVIYSSEELDTKPVSFGFKEAKERVEDFLAKHGGLPKDYELSRVSTINQEHLVTGEKDIIAWALTYRPKINGLEVVGPGGNQIDVVISDKGVFSYMRYVSPVTTRKEAAKTLSAEEALGKAAEKIAENFGIHTPVTITKAELAYLSQPFDKTPSDLRPIWRFGTDKGEEVHVDAFTGEVLSAPLR